MPPLRPSTIVVGVTVRMPRDGGELEAVVALLVAGAGEVGLALALDGGGGVGWDGGAEVGWDGFVLWPDEAGLVDDPPPGGAPPAPGVPDTCAAGFAETVGCGWLPGPLGVPPAAAMLVPGPAPGPRAALPPWWPGPAAASATASSVRAATTAAAAAAAPACPDRVCHHGDFGGSSGLGNP